MSGARPNPVVQQNYSTLSTQHREALEKIKELVDEHAAIRAEAERRANAAEAKANEAVRDILESRIEIEGALLKNIQEVTARAEAFERNRNDRVGQLLGTIERLQRAEADHVGYLKRTKFERLLSHVPAAGVGLIAGLGGGVLF